MLVYAKELVVRAGVCNMRKFCNCKKSDNFVTFCTNIISPGNTKSPHTEKCIHE